MMKDTNAIDNEIEQTLTVCPKCGRLGRLLTDRENADDGGYFDVHYWHPDTDKKCHISKAIDLNRAIHNEIEPLPNTKIPYKGTYLELKKVLNPRIYGEFIAEAERQQLTEIQAWEWAMCLFLRQGPNTIQQKGNQMPKRIQHQTHKQIIEPIAVNVEGIPEENIVSLREFYDSKMPRTHYEKALVFVYYLNKIKKQGYVKLGQIAFCYREMNERIPSVYDVAKNLERYKGYLRRMSRFTVALTAEGRAAVDVMGVNKLVII